MRNMVYVGIMCVGASFVAIASPRVFGQFSAAPGGANTLSVPQVLTLNDLIRNGASAEGATFVDLYGALSTNIPLYVGTDGLHPTAAGYQRIADTFFAAIRTAFEGR